MKLFPLLLTVFIDSLGFGLVFPIFSPMIMGNEGGMFASELSVALRGLIFGFLVSAFCLGQFFGGPVLGALSDRVGRRKILIVSVWMGFVAYLVGAIGIHLQSLALLFVARIAGGIAAGNYGVAQSVVSDTSSKELRPRMFGLMGMAWGSGLVIGPYVGGKLAPLGMPIPFMAAGFLCLVNAVLLMVALQESLKTVLYSPINPWVGVRQIRQAFQIPELRGLFLVMFVFALGWGFFTEFSPVFLVRQLGFNVGQIANFYAWVGLWVALFQGLLLRPVLRFFAPERLLSFGLVFLGVLLPVLLLMQGIISLFWLLPLVALCDALIYPNATTLVANLASEQRQGEVLGMYNAVQWVAIGISPLFSGSLVALYPHLPMTVGSGCMFVAFFILLYLLRKGDVKESN